MCKVSVIIPVYKVEQYLRECLDSVVNQTLQDLEIICVNDCSPDNSAAILEEYAAKDSRLIIVNHEVNKGLSEARNSGIQVAKGEYVYFLDSDDMLIPEAMEELYQHAKAKTLEVICFEGDTFFESKAVEQRWGFTKYWCIRSQAYEGVKPGAKLMAEMAAKEDYRALVWILFIQREYYLRAKLHFIPGILFEDNYFTLMCMLQAARAEHVFKRYYVRRMRSDSIISSKRNFRYVYGFFRSGLEMLEDIPALKLSEEDRATANKEIVKMFAGARLQYSFCEAAEQQKYLQLKPSEVVMFKELVLASYKPPASLLVRALKKLYRFFKVSV